ncbi:aldose epimerase family protein [Pedobacter arcticus]|uniref:aldose epimerase family protein n=1 Tax=Pedobacter arcticus TaxID=752140 RepID=UPI00030A13C4|nr:aldose epimerase family protein [Pedobacter arcticus]
MLENIQKAFQQSIGNKQVALFWLKNEEINVGICNYGARITHFIVSKKNIPVDITLGFNSLEEYISKQNELYYGVTVGRFANRIEDAKFTLNGERYQLDANNGGNSLHSGNIAFHNKVWDVKEVKENSIKLAILSPDGEGGFPGDLTCEVSFTLTDDNELIVNYSAKTDKDTVINLTNHAYFNLNGEESGSILNHEICINADEFLPIKENCIPKGEFEDVANTPFDFREGKTIEQDIHLENEQLKFGNGYDHSFAINQTEIMNFAASAKGDQTSLTLEIYTTEPGMQFYTGNYLAGDKGKRGTSYSERTGFCFETQHHPNSPNQQNFPSTVLKAGEEFKSITVYKVS